MGLESLVASGVALANSLTSDLQHDVVHEAYEGPNDQGAPTYGSAVQRPALVEHRQRQVRGDEGNVVMARAKVSFLHPVRIGPLDRITLPDGTTGPILDIEGMVNGSTGAPYMLEVWLG